MTEQERHLLDLYLAGAMTDSDFVRLESLLRESPEARRMLRDLATVDAKLQELAAGNPATLELLGTATPDRALGLPPAGVFNWLSVRSLATLAAGLMVGVLSASVAWAFVVPRISDGAGAVWTLLADGFEGGTELSVTGVPAQADHWSGDYSEIVAEQAGVKPATGQQMLRFLRTDYQGKPNPAGSYISDIYRLIDVRSYRQQIGDGGAVVQLSANFNALAFPQEERYECGVSLFALDEKFVTDGLIRSADSLADQSLATARRSAQKLDRTPRTWQKISTELRLPANTDFLLVRVAVQYAAPSRNKRRETFAGHFADDVRVILARRAPLP